MTGLSRVLSKSAYLSPTSFCVQTRLFIRFNAPAIMNAEPGSTDEVTASKSVEMAGISNVDDNNGPSPISPHPESHANASPPEASTQDVSVPKVNIVEPTPTDTTFTNAFPSEPPESRTNNTHAAVSSTDPAPTVSASSEPFRDPSSHPIEPPPPTTAAEETVSEPKPKNDSVPIDDILSKSTIDDSPLIGSAPTNATSDGPIGTDAPVTTVPAVPAQEPTSTGATSNGPAMIDPPLASAPFQEPTPTENISDGHTATDITPTSAPTQQPTSTERTSDGSTPTNVTTTSAPAQEPTPVKATLDNSSAFDVAPPSDTVDSISADAALPKPTQSNNTEILPDATKAFPAESVAVEPPSSSITDYEPVSQGSSTNTSLPASSHIVESTPIRSEPHEPASIRDTHNDSVPTEPNPTKPPINENEPIEPEVIDQTLVVDSRSVSDDSDYITDADRQSINTSLSSKITDFEFSNGRRYHAFGEDAYWLPNDATEIERLDIQHHVWRLSLNGALHVTPLIPSNVRNVLDIGTGTGMWAVDFAEAHPHATVLGTDLSPIQPPYVPRNCSFLIDNAENDWIFDDKFDFIHGRMLIMGIHDWPRFFRQSWDYLNPGGWLEVKEPQFPIICVDDSVTATSPLMAFSLNVRDSAARAGIDTMIVHQFREMLEHQGFVNIRVEPVKWPVGPWPRGEALKMIGRWMVPDTKEFVKPAGMKLFTTHLGWSRERVDEFMETVLQDIDDRRTHYHWLLFAICAQKPDSAT